MKEKSDRELLAMVLRTQFERVAGKNVEEIAQAAKAELGLTNLAYDRLMAGIELGKRVAEAKAIRIASLSGKMNPSQPALVESAVERMGWGLRLSRHSTMIQPVIS